ncbi:membrane-associated kinase regulator 2 [Spatholobus suberectus]|nr:membrane-associated kinase regulator 2 [Spatholobus suberectus]
MEAFSLLKYWKGGAALTPPSAAAILSQNDIETDCDDGPFFDLELAVPDEDDTNENQNDEDNNSESESESESEKEFKFTLSPTTSSNDRSLSLSPSDDLIFKGNLILNSSESEPNSKPQFTASLLKSATKFRVFMLGLRKPKPSAAAAAAPNPKHQHPKKPRQRKLFTVKFKAEEVPIVSLFTRDNSSRGKASQSQNTEESSQAEMVSSGSEEKRLVRKYLKMVKPLYVRVSRRHAEKLRISEQVDVSSPESGKAATPPSPAAEKVPTEAEASETEGTANVKGQKQGNIPLPAGLRKHLGKGRSVPAPEPALVSSKRRDDSLLQQHDWIQGAILHCKRSFNASAECESSHLARSVSDPLRETSPELSKKSTNEGNDKCI